MHKRSYHVVLNTHSGTANSLGITAEELKQQFGEGESVTVDDEMDTPLAERIEWACQSNADIVVAAGGDGTVTAIAEAILGTDKTLAILPLGTMNLLARDLGVPLELGKWVAAMRGMEPRRIDVGEVNGRIFLHKVVIGVVPGLAAGREQIRGRGALGAKIGLLRYLYRRLVRARRVAVEIGYRNGTSRVERAAAVAVANNGYDEALGHLFSRAALDGDNLTLYVVRRLAPLDVLRLSIKMLLGIWHSDAAIAVEKVRAVTLRTRKPRIKVMFDGEVETLSTPLRFRIRPAALSVLAPVSPAASDAADAVAAVPNLVATG